MVMTPTIQVKRRPGSWGGGGKRGKDNAGGGREGAGEGVEVESLSFSA